MIRQQTRPIAFVAVTAFIVFHTVTIAALFNSMLCRHETESFFSTAASPAGTAASFFWSEAKHTPTNDRKPAMDPAAFVAPNETPKIHPYVSYFPDQPVMLTSPESTPSSQRDPPAFPFRS